jgi:hypothetical protein
MLRKNLMPGAGLLALALLVLGLGGLIRPSAAAQIPFADPAFRQVWERSDRPVVEGRVARSWIWGPQPLETRREPYGADGATRLVQYFDKARMEINDPNGNRNDPFFVTNGRLVVEMVAGRIQVGPDAYENVLPAEIPVAGDVIENALTPYPVVGGELNGLTYAGLYDYANIGGAGSRAPVLPPGTAIRTLLDRGGNIIFPTVTPVAIPDDPQAVVAAYVPETGHNVPRAFWDFMHARGLVYENGTYREGPVVNWVFALGYPITEPYWTVIRIAGREYLVLLQAFERRVLTYNPANPPGWRVEMGNVGRHYQDWRYAAPPQGCPTTPGRGFGTVWAGRPPVGLNIGCPTEAGETPIRIAIEHFERGTMVWVERDREGTAAIYVLFEDGTYERYEDTWEEGQPASHGQTPPPGRYEPVRGFGKLWYENTGARIRARLGWATDLEAGGLGARQEFFNGTMVYLPPARQILVVYLTSPGAGPFRHAQLYPDTFEQ